MKRITILAAVLVLLLAGCTELIPARTTLPATEPSASASAVTGAPHETEPATLPETVPETEPETEPPTEPEPEVIYHPLNGSILEEPLQQRIFSITICNLADAIPHYNVNAADLYFESFVNGSIIRGVAFYSDLSGLDSIGSVRSDRLMFNDLSLMYDTVMCHAGGSAQVLNDATNRGVDNFNIEEWQAQGICSYRDKDRQRSGIPYENTLIAIGSALPTYAAENKGIRTTIDQEKDFNLRFRDNGTPEDGETAQEITFRITYNSWFKETTMRYSEELGKYIYHQYNKDMQDGLTGEYEAFTNVLILMGNVKCVGEYQRCDFVAGGEGWYACGGKAVPITWGAEDDHSALWFKTADGETLELGRGNSYIAITQTGSLVQGIGE